METILKRDVFVMECADTISVLLKKLGNPIMTNLYYNAVKMMLERKASIMVDRESIAILVGLVENCMQDGEMVEEVGIRSEEACERALRLLSVSFSGSSTCNKEIYNIFVLRLLSHIFSAHYLNKPTMRHLIAIMSYDVPYSAPLILKAFTHLGRYKPLCAAVDNLHFKVGIGTRKLQNLMSTKNKIYKMDRQTIQLCLDFLESSSSSDESSNFEISESSDDSFTGEEILHANVSNFIEIIEAYSDEDFKSHFRLKRSTLDQLIVKYSLSENFSMPNTNAGGKQKIDAKKGMLMFVWYICNTVTFRQLGNLFGVAKSTAWCAVRDASKWFVLIADEYIRWPQGENIEQNCAKFQSKKGIPDVIGAIDCTHIIIASPKEHQECYYNRKQNFSIILLAVVDADKKFIDIYCCGEPGSFHDSRVLRRSDLFREAQTNCHRLFPSSKFLLGDSAYAASNWIVPPFKDFGRLTDQQRRFNYIHSSTRIVVENAFGLLKGRFRRILKFTEQRNLNSVKEIVVAACVLHNLCLLNDDIITLNEETTSSENTLQNHEEPENNLLGNRRQILFDYLCEQNML